MSFFSNTIKLINTRNSINSNNSESKKAPADENVKFDFFIQNYAKESFSVLIVKPLSGCIMKIMRITSFLITGMLLGVAIALVCILISLQFESIENTTLSSLIVNEFESLLPNTDVSVESTMLRWNHETRSIEIAIKKIKLDDLSIPKISILPDYMESLKQQKFVAKTICIENPQINVDVSNDSRTIFFNPNLKKHETNKALFEPISAINNLKEAMSGVSIKLINADASVSLNGVNWNLKNLHCEYKIGDRFPKTMDGLLVLPEQGYTANVEINKTISGEKHAYDIKLGSLNPSIIGDALVRSDILLDRKLLEFIDGYKLPISGNVQLNFKGEKFLRGDFNLVGSSGAIKLPTSNTLSLNLGKKIDSGSISGSFSKDSIKINSLNIAYGNSEIQLTGIKVPLDEYKFLDVANIDGTLSLINVDIQEMDALLPSNISKSTVPTFRNYLPGFRLELFKIDLRGPIAFGDRADDETLSAGQGIFKIKDAKIPIGDHIVTNINATGSISNDGFDIKLASADFLNTKINSGIFFLSKKDDSWIGKINADVKIDEISSHIRDISRKLTTLPIEKLDIKGMANLDLKLVRIPEDPLIKKDLPFRIVGGAGVIKSDDNTKELKLFWDENGLLVSGDVRTGKNRINLRVEEDFSNNSGIGSFNFVSNSDFLNALIPNFHKICDGNFNLKINQSWDGTKEEYDVSLNLRDAVMTLPIVGTLKQKADEGVFTAHIRKEGDNFEFSKMDFKTKGGNINGHMTLSNTGDILQCTLDKFEINDCSAKINILRDQDQKILFSVVGDSLNASKAISRLSQFSKDSVVSAYVDLKEMAVSNMHKVKNVKGNFDIKNGKIIGGACYAVIGNDTTLALTSKNIDGTSDSMVSLSVSNAGEFLKYLKITDTIKGGSINIVTKTSKNADESLSGAFEMSDFIVANSPKLMKLLYFSSSVYLPSSDNASVGFNFCDGNFIIADNQINISGRAISPAIGISYNGVYDRTADNLDISGISLPMSFLLNNQGSNESLAANYSLSGSLETPAISVKPMKLTPNDDLNEIFGNILPIAAGDHVNSDIAPTKESLSDPFSKKAFDKKAEHMSAAAKMGKRTKQEHRTDKKFGVMITRGLKTN